MPRFAANLTMMFNEVAFVDRFAAAAKAGFTGVEFLFPYDHDVTVLKQALRDSRLTQVLHNLPAGNWQAGERGIACHPDRTKEFDEGVERAMTYATALGCTQLNSLAGIAPAGANPADVRRTFVGNIKRAAARLKTAGIRLLIEPINTRDIPNFFLSRTAQAVEIIKEIGADNVLLQYDVYHMQIMEGDLSKTIERHLPLIAHMQIADPPARNEPGTGEINYSYLFKHVDKLGYAGWIGCEYKPAGRTEDGLGWIQKLK